MHGLLGEIEIAEQADQSCQDASSIDAIKGIEAVKAASAESSFRDAMLNEFLSVSQKMFKANFIVMSYDSVLQTIGLLSTAIFLWVGATQVIHGHLSVGGFVAFSSLTAMAYAGILRTLGVWDSMQFASVLLNRLNDIFEQEPEQGHDRSRLVPVHSLEGRIELRGVSFKYGGPEAPDILKNITLDLAPGRMVAFVGRSGCGKTTLIKLIAGLLRPTSGEVLIDGRPPRENRGRLGFLGHDLYLYPHLSVSENLVLFARLYDVGAAEAAEALRAVGMSHKKDALVHTLSQGEGQRVALARAVLHDPDLLLVDEPFSGLDEPSAAALPAVLKREGRTLVVATHDTERGKAIAERIVILENGRISAA